GAGGGGGGGGAPRPPPPGREAAARAAADGAQARAALEVTAAERHLRVALTRLEIARRSEEQAAEAHRIVSRKYDGGLATVAELLDAADAEMRTRLGRSSARYETLIAIAERRQAQGRTLEPLTALDP
ncbi:MAG: hypothetical protein IRY91_07785, partial [Gemmatimonadaceae bacterium]|nr:hypothetical protein [Gemmatimonadaceae bacterium]